MADYPDHLNPFKRNNGIRGSFRTLKNAIGGRFRKKKDHDQHNHITAEKGTSYEGATLRHHQTINGTPRTIQATSELLPRSRFNERVGKAHTLAPTTRTISENEPYNPFGEETDNVTTPATNGRSDTIDALAKVRNGTETRRRRRKKRAPLPPGVLCNRLGVPGDHSSSQWSISSYETDYSTTTAYTHSENELDIDENPERLKDIQEISKEIQMLCVTDVETSSSANTTNIEETVTTVTNGTIKHDDPVKDNDGETASEEIANQPTPNVDTTDTNDKDNNINDINDISPENAQPHPTADTLDKNLNKLEAEATERNIAKVAELDVDDSKKNSTDEANGEINNNQVDKVSATNCEKQEVNPHTSILADEGCTTDSNDCDNNGKAITCEENAKEVEAITTPMNNEETLTEAHQETQNANHQPTNGEEGESQIDYVQRKSLYIAGSIDNLDFNESRTLYITGSGDQLDAPADNSEMAPTPKIRKHKLSRDDLLGSNDVLNVAVG